MCLREAVSLQGSEDDVRPGPPRWCHLLSVVSTLGAIALLALASSLQLAASPPASVFGLLLAVDRMLESRWYVAEQQSPQRLADQGLLRQALSSPDPQLRRAAVRSIGRFENRLDVPTIVVFLDDSDVGVRREAANALVQSLRLSNGPEITVAAQALMAHRRPGELAIDEALVSLHYGDLIPDSSFVDSLPPQLLLRLLRQAPNLRLRPEVIQGLRRIAAPLTAQPNPAALEILLRTNSSDEQTVTNAARYHCVETVETGCGWESRYVAAQFIDPKDPRLGPLLNYLAEDSDVRVRLAALRSVGGAVSKTKDCRLLLDAIRRTDQLTTVAKVAIGFLNENCDGQDEIALRLASLATDLGRTGDSAAWPVATQAMEALSHFDRAAARDIMSNQAISHAIWQVRAAAARTATTLRDEGALIRLVDDAEPNVRSEAIRGLTAIGSRRSSAEALRALDSTDDQLVVTAAYALKGAHGGKEAATVLLQSLKRLTALAKDTSRESRLAILAALSELAKDRVNDVSALNSFVDDGLLALLGDFDPLVAEAAADAIAAIRGERPTPHPTHRAPQQPTLADLISLPSKATIIMENNDQIGLELLVDQAPITVARFVGLVRRHYYDRLEFYQIAPLIAVQGGSPNANEFSGDARFLRDELGLERHTRGAVGLATHSRDTGNAQFFIDVLDQQGFDHEYTVFGRVVGFASGPHESPRRNMSAVDAMQEGARILQILLG